MKHWQGGFAKDEFRSTVGKETESVHQRKTIQWGECLYFSSVSFYKAKEVEPKPSAARLHHGAVSADVVTLTSVEPLAGSAGVSTARFAMYQTHSLQSKTKADEVRSGSHESFKKKQHTQSPP